VTTDEFGVRRDIPGMIDGRDRVTGAVPFVINHELPGMLHAKLVRSTAPHARIVGIRVASARRVPGVVAVVTGADLVSRGDISPYFGPFLRDQPVLADGKVRFVGEPIAAVVAESVSAAEEAADLVEIEYDELPAVFDPVAAFDDDAPVLHVDPPKKSRLFVDVSLRNRVGTNVANVYTIRKGDIERGFAEADHVFEDVFISPAVQHVPLETHVCLASVSRGAVTVWSSTQTPHVVRAQLADIFNLPLSSVRVIVSTLGGGYGAKTYPKLEPVTAVLALITGRPVRLHLTREEEFVTITKHGATIRMKTGVRRDGVITARQSVAYFNTGAYADVGPRVIVWGGFGQGGPYRIPNLHVDTYCMYTNTPPAGAFRGFGINQTAWAHETQIEMIAERLGMDPLEIRMKNVLNEGEAFATGDAVENWHSKELLQAVANDIGWVYPAVRQQVGSVVRAKGISVSASRAIPLAVSTAAIKMNMDGSVNVLSSSVEMGQGIQTALALLAAEALSIPPSQVRVSEVDTEVTPYDQQSSASRGTYSMAAALEVAVDDVKQQLREMASEELEVSAEDLEFYNGAVRVKGSAGQSRTYGELVRNSRSGNIIGQGRYRAGGALHPETGLSIGPGPGHWHQAAGAAEVEVDLDTGHTTVLRYSAAVFAGRVINRVQAELQTEGNVAFGVGQALFEEMLFDHGQLQNANLGDYMIASINDMPLDLTETLLELPERGEIHGLGETTLPSVMPAIAAAIYNATGVRITDLPATSEKVLRGLQTPPQREDLLDGASDG
jgi:CO/xanthine dehydrogenase Mo-binding subunit